MTTKDKTSHTCEYFRSIKRFYPYATQATVEDKKVCKGKGTQILPRKRRVPEALEAQLVSTLFTLETLVRSGTDPSVPPYLRRSRSPVLIYEDSEIEAIANNSEFIELIVFYADPLYAQAGRALTRLEKDKDGFYVISASTPEGSPFIMNYVFPAMDLANFITILSQDVTHPIQELLAYRTKNLYSALLLASSKPF